MAATGRRSRIAVAVLVWLAWPAAAAAQSSPTGLVFTPSVLSPGTTGPLLIEAELTAAPTRVSLDFNPAGTTLTQIELRDDGAEGDRVAGDRTYSVRVPVGPILAARTLDDVNRVFVGFLDIFNGTARMRFNLFVDVYTSVVGEYPITRLSQFVQATTRLVNIHSPAYFASRNIVNVVLEFYRSFPDEYDFVNMIADPQRFENRYHSVIANDVSGIGQALTNGARSWGSSSGRLLGLSSFPIARLYDGAETGYLHELGHQWINHLRIQPFAVGVPHWPYSTMASGVMGFSIGGTGGQGGNYGCVITEDPRGYVLTPRVGAPGFNDLDLYLMGLMPANEVRDQFVFADQSAAAQLPCSGVFTGAMTRVRIADVMGTLGARAPAFGAAPRTYRAATILVTRDGLAAPEMMWLYSYLTERAEWRARVPTHSGFAKELGQPFFVATRGRGSLEVDIGLQRPDFAVLPGTAEVTVPAGTPARYQITAFSRQSTFTQPVTLSCESLPANAGCTFDQESVVPGAGGQTTVVSISTANVARGTHVVIVSGRSGGEKHSTAVTVTVQ